MKREDADTYNSNRQSSRTSASVDESDLSSQILDALDEGKLDKGIELASRRTGKTVEGFTKELTLQSQLIRRDLESTLRYILSLGKG